MFHIRNLDLKVAFNNLRCSTHVNSPITHVNVRPTNWSSLFACSRCQQNDSFLEASQFIELFTRYQSKKALFIEEQNFYLIQLQQGLTKIRIYLLSKPQHKELPQFIDFLNPKEYQRFIVDPVLSILQKHQFANFSNSQTCYKLFKELSYYIHRIDGEWKVDSFDRYQEIQRSALQLSTQRVNTVSKILNPAVDQILAFRGGSTLKESLLTMKPSLNLALLNHLKLALLSKKEKNLLFTLFSAKSSLVEELAQKTKSNQESKENWLKELRDLYFFFLELRTDVFNTRYLSEDSGIHLVVDQLLKSPKLFEVQQILLALVQLTAVQDDLIVAGSNSAHILCQTRFNFTGSNLSKVRLKYTNLAGANLMRANLKLSEFESVNLTKCNLKDANLQGVNWIGISGAEVSCVNKSTKRLTALALNFTVQYSKSGAVIASGIHGTVIKLFDANNYSLLGTLHSHQGSVKSVDFHPSERYLVSGSTDMTIRLWNLRSFACARVFRGHHGSVESVCFFNEGSMIASAGSDYQIIVQTTKGHVLRVLKGHHNVIVSIKVCANASQLISCGRDSLICFWDLLTGRLNNQFQGHNFIITCLALAPHKNEFASAGTDFKVKIWSRPSGNSIKVIEIGLEHPLQVTYSPDGSLLAVACSYSVVKLYNTETYELVAHLTVSQARFVTVSFSHNGQHLAVGTLEKTLRVYDVKKLIADQLTLGHSTFAKSVCFLPHGSNFLASGNERSVCLWSSEDAQLLHQYAGLDRVAAVDSCPNGQMIALCNAEGRIQILNARNQQEIRCISGVEGRVTSIKFSNDGSQLVSAGSQVKLWDVQTSELIHTLQGLTGVVNSVAFLPKQSVLLTGSSDFSIRVWSTKSGIEQGELLMHGNEVNCIAVSRCGNYFCSSSQDPSINFWSASTFSKLWQINEDRQIFLAVDFTPDGRFLLAGGRCEGIYIYNIEKQVKVRKLNTQFSYCQALQTSPDGQYFVSGDRYQINVWKIQASKRYLQKKKRQEIQNDLALGQQSDHDSDCNYQLHHIIRQESTMLKDQAYIKKAKIVSDSGLDLIPFFQADNPRRR